MAEETVSVELDNQSLFDAALAPQDGGSSPNDQPPAAPPAQEPPAPPPSQEPPPAQQPTRPEQDEHGRFTGRRVPAEPGQQQEPPPQAAGGPEPPEGFAPSWRLREEREAREAMAERLAQTNRQLQEAVGWINQQRAQQTQQVPDPVLQPMEYRQHIEGAFNHQLRTLQLENNLQLTRLEHGAQLFDQAYSAFMQVAPTDPQFARAIVNGPNPGAAMIDWFRRASTLSQVGDDPEAWFQQRLAQEMQKPEFLAGVSERARGMALQRQQQGGGVPANVTVLPPSLSRLPGGQSAEGFGAPGVDGDAMSNESLFASALPQRRHR